MQPTWSNQQLGIDLYHGDARVILPQLNATVDSIITDPPYGINLQPQRKKTSAISNDHRNEAKALFYAVLPELDRLVKLNSAHCIFGGWSELWCPEAIKEWWTLKSCIVWKKNVWGLGYYTRPQHEFIWYVHKGKPPTPAAAVSDVWEAKRVARPIHSCQKPVELLERCINFTTQPGELIIDPFLGSGSTALAALNTGRRCIGIESDAQHFTAAVQRLEQELARREHLGAAA